MIWKTTQCRLVTVISVPAELDYCMLPIVRKTWYIYTNLHDIIPKNTGIITISGIDRYQFSSNSVQGLDTPDADQPFAVGHHSFSLSNKHAENGQAYILQVSFTKISCNNMRIVHGLINFTKPQVKRTGSPAYLTSTNSCSSTFILSYAFTAWL